MEGGFARFPGLSEPLTIETSELPPERGREIEGLVARSGVWDLASGGAARPRPGQKRDHRSYTLELSDGVRQCRVELEDPVSPALAPLVQALRAELGQRRA